MNEERIDIDLNHHPLLHEGVTHRGVVGSSDGNPSGSIPSLLSPSVSKGVENLRDKDVGKHNNTEFGDVKTMEIETEATAKHAKARKEGFILFLMCISQFMVVLVSIASDR